MDAGEYRAGAAAHGDVVERNARLPVEHYSVHIGLSVDRKADRSAGTAEITGIAVKPVVELRFVQDEGVGSGHRCRFYRGAGQERDLTEAGSVRKCWRSRVENRNVVGPSSVAVCPMTPYALLSSRISLGP